jgi:hypothetical protein
MANQIAARAAVRAAPGAAGVSVTNPAPCKRVGNLLIRNPPLRIVLLNVPSNYLERRRLDCPNATVIQRAQITDPKLQVLRYAFAKAPIAVVRARERDYVPENAFIARRRLVQTGWLNLDRA